MVTSPRQSRPKKISNTLERSICRKVRENPSLGSSKIAIDLEKNFSIQVSSATIRRTLIRNNLKAYRKVKKPMLTQRMKKKRLAWAKKYESKPNEFWDRGSK